MSKLFVCIHLMVEGVGNIVDIFNRRPIVFKKLIMFLRAVFLNSSSRGSPYKTFFCWSLVLCILSKCV